MRGFAYLRNVSSLRLCRETCDGCRMCIDVCPHQVFAMRDKRAFIIARDACMECGACQRNCPQSAIAVDSGVGCGALLIQTWVGGARAARTKTGCC